jgi:GTPase
MDEPILNVRKSSYVVEEYHTDHYNSEYPSLGIGKDIVPSNTINIVVVGHVDSGKSTLVGIFLKEAAFLDKKEVHRNEK